MSLYQRLEVWGVPLLVALKINGKLMLWPVEMIADPRQDPRLYDTFLPTNPSADQNTVHTTKVHIRQAMSCNGITKTRNAVDELSHEVLIIGMAIQNHVTHDPQTEDSKGHLIIYRICRSSWR